MVSSNKNNLPNPNLLYKCTVFSFFLVFVAASSSDFLILCLMFLCFCCEFVYIFWFMCYLLVSQSNNVQFEFTLEFTCLFLDISVC